MLFSYDKIYNLMGKKYLFLALSVAVVAASVILMFTKGPSYGIDFSGNANASGMSSELLDDYEEGTFTATIGSNGTHPTITQGNTIDCRYTKIGNVCTVHGYSGVRNITAVGTGSPLISGLPFTATNYAQPVLGHCNMFPDSVSGYVEVNQSYFFPIKVGATAHDAYTTGAKYIMFSMTYRVN